MKVLVSNVGSTSLKFKLFSMPEERLLCESKVERVGSSTDALFYFHNLSADNEILKENCSIATYSDGILRFLTCLVSPDSGVLAELSELDAIGFKTVLAKGYYGIHELTDNVMRGLEEYMFVAPAHNGPYIEAISVFRNLLPKTRMIGVFETAFHTTIPLYRRMYAIPYEWFEKYGIKRMGYHGASHSYVAQTLEKTYGETGKAISCHLGGSSSICAIRDGKSEDTSFGFSLQTGIPHANRTGDLDPYIIPFLMSEGMELSEILQGLSKRGGLLGISGVSNDLREIQQAMEHGNERAALAVDTFVSAIVKCIGAFYAELGGLDRLVFTGGIGENSSMIREKVCTALIHLGIELDNEKNAERGTHPRTISSEISPVKILVIPANEEIGIARNTYDYILGDK
ncbi:MAG: acetate/propionate family kinase [Oscillospiraceae bacterium]